jgi:hypothetical protein
MSLFDFLKKNKNIITDNGTNYIYYDFGKGAIKEKFSKVNGVINGEYVEYDRNGTFQLKTYKDGLICLTDEQIIENKRKEEIYNNIGIEISKLKVLDELISEITGIFLLVQMENSKIDYFAKLIENKLNKQFDEECIKFYLYSKRNYFIKKLIQFGEYNDENIKFTDHIVNYIKDLKRRSVTDFIKFNYSDSYFVKSAIFRELFLDDNTKTEVTSKVNIYGDGRGIVKQIFNHQSILFGLNFNTYKLIYEIIEKKSREFKHDMQDKDNIESANDIYEILRVNDESLLNNETQLKPSQMDKYAQKVVNEILSLCINNKVNQEDIILEL